MKKLRINNKIVNKSVLKDIKKFKRDLKNSNLSQNEIDLLVNKEFKYNPKYRFIKIDNNYWFDRFTKTYHTYTQPLAKKGKRTDLRNAYLKLLKAKHINNLMLNKNLSKDEATKEYDNIIKKITVNQTIQTFGS